MSSPIILVPGTWANTDRNAPQDSWWKVGSEFYNELTKRGFQALSFAWDTDLDGVIGEDTHWEKAGERLAHQATLRVSIIAHSHGGNVVAYAAKQGLQIDHLITIATPVRSDVPYEAIKATYWTHIYGNYEDYVQLLGELNLWHFNSLRRQMGLADLNIKYPIGHSKLHDINIWNQENWWRFL